MEEVTPEVKAFAEKVLDRIDGIEDEDLTTAEQQIKKLCEKVLKK